MKSVKLDKKREWYEERVLFTRMLLTKVTNTHYKLLIQEHFNKETMKFTPLYETPKVYDKQGVAYNKDKNWVIYKTIKNKKTTIYCKTKNKLMRTFISYMGFLKLAGIDNASVMYLFTLIFMDRLKWYQGLFDCTAENKKWLQDKILKVLVKSNDEITKNWTRSKKNRKGCWDDRELAFDTTGMSKSEVTRKQHKIMNKKEKTDNTIEKYYDSDKSIRKNLEILKENGVKCSKSRLGSWVKEHNESVQNGDASIKSEINESVQNGDAGITEGVQNGDAGISEIKTQSVQNGDASIKSQLTESVQNGDAGITESVQNGDAGIKLEQENDENGVSKMDHNSSYIEENYYKKEVKEVIKEVEEEVRKEKEIIEEENNKRKRKIEEEKNKFFSSTDKEEENYSNMTDYSYELDDLFKLLGA